MRVATQQADASLVAVPAIPAVLARSTALLASVRDYSTQKRTWPPMRGGPLRQPGGRAARSGEPPGEDRSISSSPSENWGSGVDRGMRRRPQTGALGMASGTSPSIS